jgi:hypothetical protein
VTDDGQTQRARRPSPAPEGWDFRFATNDAAKGWEQLCAAAPANSRRAWDRITRDPREHDSRQHRLKGSLGSRAMDGVELEQWQHEVTGAGRLWYCIDDIRRIVWMTACSVGHPRVTE